MQHGINALGCCKMGRHDLNHPSSKVEQQINEIAHLLYPQERSWPLHQVHERLVERQRVRAEAVVTQECKETYNENLKKLLT